jgi:hypothetical protein
MEARACSGTIMQMRSCSDITARASIPFHPVLFFSLVRSFAHLPSRVYLSLSFSRGRVRNLVHAPL